MTLDKLFNLPGPDFPHLQKGDDSDSHLKGLVWK